MLKRCHTRSYIVCSRVAGAAYGVLSDHRKRELYHQYGPSLAVRAPLSFPRMRCSDSGAEGLQPSAGDQVASTFDLIVPVMGGILAGCVIGTMYSSGMVGMLMAVVLALAAMLGLTQAAGGTVPFSTTAKSVLGGGVVTVALGAVIALVVQAVPASH